MDYNYQIVEFCEKRIYPNQPEYLNAFSALFICYISYKEIRKIKNINKNKSIVLLIHSCIFINGISAFLYHWYNLYIFKLFDVYSMIIPLWIGLFDIMVRLNYQNKYIVLLSIFNITFLVLIVFPWFDKYFVFIFANELILFIPLYIQFKKENENTYFNNGIKGIIICTTCGIIWTITEINCNVYFILGHPFWHIGMSYGLSFLINYFIVENSNFIKYKNKIDKNIWV